MLSLLRLLKIVGERAYNMLSYSPVFQVDEENGDKNSMRLGATVPNFKAQTTEGPIEFYDWQGDS